MDKRRYSLWIQYFQGVYSEKAKGASKGIKQSLAVWQLAVGKWQLAIANSYCQLPINTTPDINPPVKDYLELI